MFCKYCGKELDERSAFCKYCGKAQPSASVESTKPRRHMRPTAAVGNSAYPKKSQMPFVKHLKATCKLLSLAGWASLVIGILLAALTVFALLKSIFTLNLSLLTEVGIFAIGAMWCYIFGVHQFWNAAAIEDNLSIKLPKGKDDAAWLVHIRENFNFEGATLTEQQPENALVYLLNDAQMYLTAEDGILRITVKHSKRFNSAKSGGHWELDESFSADDLKCALALFVQGQPLPDNFAQEQKKKHKDKVGKVKKGIIIGSIAMVLLLLIVSIIPPSPLKSLQNCHWGDSTTQTLSEAFAENFEKGKWDSYKVDGGTMAVFTGVINFTEYFADDEAKLDIELDFMITDKGDYYNYRLVDVKVNNVPIPSIYDDYKTIFLDYGLDGDIYKLVETMYYLDM